MDSQSRVGPKNLYLTDEKLEPRDFLIELNEFCCEICLFCSFKRQCPVFIEKCQEIYFKQDCFRKKDNKEKFSMLSFGLDRGDPSL